MRAAVQIDPSDSVGVALQSLPAGTVVQGVSLATEVPAGHKFAIKMIPAGSPVIKYGFSIGKATCDIAPGEHVHTHNVHSDLHADLEKALWHGGARQDTSAGARKTFQGYRRANGAVGIRNEIWIIPTVGCVNQAALKIAAEAQQRFGGGEGIDGIFAMTHPFGCSQLGDDLERTQKILAGLVRHPNAAGVLLIGLGCENNQMCLQLDMIEKQGGAGGTASGNSPAAKLAAAGGARVRYFNTQEVSDEFAEGLRLVGELAEIARKAKRQPIDARELILGMKCGGSDGFSGITGNPLVGRVADRVAGLGGTVLLTEVPEMFGAEQVLLDRAADEGTFKGIIGLCNDFRKYFRSFGQPIDENPSPGNKAGGITTNAEKSLGCVQKGGRAPITGVLDYGHAAPARAGGVVLLNAPGNDGVSSTALAAAGAHMVLFTTGRGNPLGTVVPTLKISTNSDLAARKPGWIDFDAGALAGDGVSMEALGEELFDRVLAIASGEKAKNELNGCREIAIWKNGVTL
jgi:altronate hydrolase